jgi:hypothetical protein
MIERALIEGWLADAGLEAQEVELDEEVVDDFAWALMFKGVAFKIVVAHRAVEWNALMMEVSLNVADDHIELLRGLDPDVRDRFMHDLRILLLQQPVGYQLRFLDDEPEILSAFTVGLTAMEEPLQRSGFFRRNHQLQSASLLAVQVIRKLARFGTW